MEKGVNRVVYLDLVRAVAIFYIVAILHSLGFLFNQELMPTSLKHLIESLTDTNLALFTYISGWFLGKYNIRNIADMKKFYIRRIYRFFPLFFIACFSMYLAGLLLSHDTVWFRDVFQLLSTLTGLSGFIKDGQPATFWYMSMIMLFYILTPILLYKSVRSYKNVVALIFIFTIVELFEGDKRIVFYFVFYILGLMQFQYLIVNKIILFIVGLIYFILSIYFNFTSILTFYNFTVVCLGCILGLSVCSMFCNRINQRLIGFVAYSSMSVYLFHRHVFAFAKMLMNGDLWPLWFWPIVIVFTFSMAYYIQLIYDKTINKICTK